MKKNITLASAYLLAFSLGGFAQQTYKGEEAAKKVAGTDLIRYNTNSALPVEFEFTDQGQARLAFLSPETVIKDALKLKENNGLKNLYTKTDQHGITRYKYQQTYKGIPVESATYHANKREGLMLSLFGEFYEVGQVNTTPSINESDALNKALNHMGATKYRWENADMEADLRMNFGENETYYPKGNLVIFPEKGEFNPETKFKLAYKFQVYAEEPLAAYEMYVDAQSGELMHKYNLIHEADEKVKAKTRYRDVQEITVDNNGGTYCIKEAGRGNGIVTYDAQNRQNASGTKEFCTQTAPIDLTNQRLDQVSCDAHYAAELTYDYLKTVHNRNSLDDRGWKLISYVHLGNNLFNAFWDGRVMAYGDGRNGSPMTTIDIGGHEIGHGLTTNTSNLRYQGESGALNESFADIQGNFLEHWSDKARWTDLGWLCGNELGNGDGSMAIRSMKNPNQFKHPDTYKGDNWAPTNGGDNGGVHTNSGVQNHWFYLMVVGGTGTNDNGDAFEVTGIGWDDADMVQFTNHTAKLSANSKYADARAGAVAAAKEIFGECSQQHKTTEDAWYAVGVGAKSNCTVVEQITAKFEADKKVICAGQEVQFTDLSEGDPTAWEWDFGNGQTSTEQNPRVTFDKGGKYTVKLKITKGAANDEAEEKEYITVSEPKSLPVAEDFEDSFPGVGWMVENPDNDITWDKSKETGVGSKSCLIIKNAEYQKVGEKDALFLPEVDLSTGLNDPVLTFFVAYTRFNDEAKDKLKVHISDDCGESWNEVYFKEKEELETKEVDFDESQEWIPENQEDWRWETVDLAKYKKKSIKIKFESTNGYGNNIWVDKINIDFTSGKNNLSNLQNSLVVAPNPNNGQFTVKFKANQKDNYTLQVRNLLGEIVFSKAVNNFNGLYYTNINLNANAKGIYMLSVEGKNGKVVQKIIKE